GFGDAGTRAARLARRSFRTDLAQRRSKGVHSNGRRSQLHGKRHPGHRSNHQKPDSRCARRQVSRYPCLKTQMTNFAAFDTPAALVDVRKMQANIARMQSRMDTLGVKLRPHVKTSKSLPVVQAQLEAGARGITVSTLKEAEEFFAAGIDDILYAVGIAPNKLPRALALRRKGCDLKLITDNVAGAEAVARFGREHGETFEVWIEMDVDGNRSGIPPESDLLLDVGRALHEGGVRLGGVMTHAGGSYAFDTPEALQAAAEQERAGTVRAAERLRQADLPCPVVSVGSTPTALSAQSLEGVTEVRAGVYVFFDLV